MGPLTGGMVEGLLVSNSPFLGDFLDQPLTLGPWKPPLGQILAMCLVGLYSLPLDR